MNNTPQNPMPLLLVLELDIILPLKFNKGIYTRLLIIWLSASIFDNLTVSLFNPRVLLSQHDIPFYAKPVYSLVSCIEQDSQLVCVHSLI